ncbi:copper resistance protein CopC [Micromonospora sp. NPDC049559]|uniref:copper resistance CopC/CopD family protein n=1 Tax=Micromonospora sp. NPDC049559 TaxID=3155923 RepID=UPI0034238FFA
MIAAKPRWLARLAATVVLLVPALALLLGPAGPASAHAVLVGSTPPADAVLTSAPAQIVLTFSESVRQVPDKIRVVGPDGARADRGEPKFDGATVTIPLDQGGPRGTYLVSYRVISADSHPVSGGFTYSYGNRSAAPTDDGGETSVNRSVSVAVPVAKYLGYAGLVLLIGPVLVLSLLWPRRLSRTGPGRLVWAGAGLVAFATLAGIWLQVPYTTGGGLFAVSADQLGDVLGSPFGAAHLIRLGVLVAAAILLRPLLAGRSGRVDHALLVILGVVGLVTWPLAGHPSASPIPAVSVVVDGVHLASMAVWLGGLLMLAAYLLRQANTRELGAILPVWSRWATAAVSALVLAGLVQLLIEIGTPAALIETTYGRLVLAKIALLTLVLLAAAYSRRLVLRRALADAAGTGTTGDDAAGTEEIAAGDGAAEAAEDDEPAARAGDAVTAASTGTGASVLAAAGGTADATPAGGVAVETRPGGDAAVPDEGMTGTARRLRRSVLVELVITAVVLALSATLVQTTPARTAAANSEAAAPGYYSATLTSSLYALQVEIDPAQTGNNDVHLYALSPDNKPLPVLEWKATAALPAKGIEPIDMALLQLTDDHAYGSVTLPTAGDWELRFTLRTTEIDQATVTATVPVK